jgi:hypothetical protein
MRTLTIYHSLFLTARRAFIEKFHLVVCEIFHDGRLDCGLGIGLGIGVAQRTREWK